MYRLFATTAFLATLTHASPQIYSLPGSSSSDTTTPSHPTSEVPNITPALPNNITSLASNPLPIIPIPSVTNHIGGGPAHNLTTNGTCVTVTAQGEPMFTIQTDTVLHTPCTVTVPAGPGPVGPMANSTGTMTGSGASGSSAMTGTNSAGSGSGGAASGGSGSGTAASSTSAASSGNPANRVVMGVEGLGLAVFVGALGLL